MKSIPLNRAGRGQVPAPALFVFLERMAVSFQSGAAMGNRIMLVVFAAGLLALAGCGRVEKWEYKTVRVENDVHQENAKLDSKSDDYLSLVAYNNRHPGRLAISDYALNQLGADGWEMCGCFVEPETLQPDTRMAAPNTRASAVVMIFKRPAAR